MLHEFVAFNREESIRRCKTRVATRAQATAADPEIDHGVPLFLDQLVSKLRLPETAGSDISASAATRGHGLLLKGFTMSQVVYDFRPFERGADRTGMGIGLAFSRWGTEANHGRLYGRNLPDEGCVFTVDLPRLATAGN